MSRARNQRIKFNREQKRNEKYIESVRVEDQEMKANKLLDELSINQAAGIGTKKKVFYFGLKNNGKI